MLLPATLKYFTRPQSIIYQRKQEQHKSAREDCNPICFVSQFRFIASQTRSGFVGASIILFYFDCLVYIQANLEDEIVKEALETVSCIFS